MSRTRYLYPCLLCSSYITICYIIRLMAFIWHKLFLPWHWGSCDFGKGSSNEEQGLDVLKVVHQNVCCSRLTTNRIFFFYIVLLFSSVMCQKIQTWNYSGWLMSMAEFHAFVFAVVGLTIFNSCYVPSMETCLFCFFLNGQKWPRCQSEDMLGRLNLVRRNSQWMACHWVRYTHQFTPQHVTMLTWHLA